LVVLTIVITIINNEQGRLAGSQLSPADLHKASKRLEKAVVDFYRHLMLLDNYALFNFTAFQKVLFVLYRSRSCGSFHA
jgi:hypothetical protein